MGKILYHLKEDKAISISFNAPNNVNDDWQKGIIAIQVLKSLKKQDILDSVIYTTNNNETINLI